MIRPAAIELGLEGAAVAALLPQRPPLLLVDRIDRFVPGPSPRLRASLRLRGDEPVFAGHFPGRPIWPGVYQIEGLAQAAALLLVLDAMFESQGRAAIEALGELVEHERPRAFGLLARAEATFTSVVEPPTVLRYDLRLRLRQSGVARLDGQVGADGRGTAEVSLAIKLEQP